MSRHLVLKTFASRLRLGTVSNYEEMQSQQKKIWYFTDMNPQDGWPSHIGQDIQSDHLQLII